MAFCALRAVPPPWCLVKAGMSQAPSILLPPPGSLLAHWALADYQAEWAEPQARSLTLQGSLQDQAGGSAVTRLVGKTAPTQVLGLGSARKLASLSKCTRGLTAQGTPPSFQQQPPSQSSSHFPLLDLTPDGDMDSHPDEAAL